MDEEQRAKLLAEWLNGPAGRPPPEGLDDETLAAVYALSPARAPSPRVSVEDILAQVSEGPFATPSQTAGEVVGFPAPAKKAAPARRSRPSRLWWAFPGVGVALAAAAAVAILVPTLGHDAAQEQMYEAARTASAPAAPPPPPPPSLPEMAQPADEAPAAVTIEAPRSPAAEPDPAAAPVGGARGDGPAADGLLGGAGGFAGTGASAQGDLGAGTVSASGYAGNKGAEANVELRDVEQQARRELPATELDAAPVAAPAPADSMTRAPARAKDKAEEAEKKSDRGTTDDEDAFLDEGASEEESSSLAKAPAKAAKAERPRASTTPAPAAPPASAPAGAAAAADTPSGGMATRAAATPLDYDPGWFRVYADVVPVYQQAAAREGAKDWAGAVALYQPLVKDPRVDLAQDAAWRAGRALWAQGKGTEALAMVRAGLARSSAATVFRVHLLVLQGDLLNAMAMPTEATRSWDEAADQNRER